ncbi:MAG TPA: HEPN domain-containing protein [Nitrospirota bacterium]|nr:HEPN domain-containing protein [Nitrospirota bacterium]
MTYESLKETGIVEERPAEISEIIALVTRAERDLMTSKILQDKDEEWAFAAAYLAMVRSARALIISEGLRPKGVRGRDAQKTVVTAAGVILGDHYKSLINKFDRMRRKYQSFMEEAGRVISQYEAGQAIKDAAEFIELVNGRIREKYSQLSLLNDVPQLVSR